MSNVHHSKARDVAREQDLLTTRQVCEVVDGLTFRMLDHWTRCGLVTPTVDSPGSGYVRLWSKQDLHEIRDIKQRVDACPFSGHQGGHR